MSTGETMSAEGSDGSADGIDFPAAPRMVPAGVRRAAMWEPRVRFWLLAGMALLVIVGVLGMNEYGKWAEDRDLIVKGTPVEATVTEASGTDIRGRRQPWNGPVKLKFTTAAGAEQVVDGLLRERPGGSEVVVVGQPLKIRYDAASPGRWTDRTEVPSIANALISVYLLLPAALAAGAVGLWQRGRVIKTYATGTLTPAAVVSTASSAIAPGYVKVTAAMSAERGQENRTVTVFVPKAKRVAKGDVVYVLVPVKSGIPLAVDAF